ncbi:hypothetical protein PYV50_09105 [Pseudomonas sp. H22_DOA]|nr:hypothetical protein PYV50_09105 [Pseudomonas sp. H22_DOA]
MSANDLPGNTTTLFKELDIPGRTGPVSQRPMVWGINRAAAHDNFPRQGLLCRAGPWGLMEVGDTIAISMAGLEVLRKIVDKHEVDKELQMFVPAARLHEGPFTVSYTVTRLNQTPLPSEVTDYVFKGTAPAVTTKTIGRGIRS